MPTIKTHEILAEALTARVVHVTAQAFGVNEQTVRAWRHPKESDLNPTGTGKANPLDQAARIIRVIHQYNPGAARQAAEFFIDLVNQLDEEQGVGSQETGAGEGESILDRLREEIKEAGDVTLALIGKDMDPLTLRRARKEIAEDIAALHRLDASVNAELEKKSAAG